MQLIVLTRVNGIHLTFRGENICLQDIDGQEHSYYMEMIIQYIHVIIDMIQI